MATEIHTEKPLEDVMRNLKVDPSTEVSDANAVGMKDGTPSDATSCISSSGDATSSLKGSDLDQESVMTDQGVYYHPGGYYGYCYPGYDVSFGEWDDQGYVLGCGGLEIQYPAIQADNGSAIYYMPGLQPGYNPYASYISGAVVGMDGQYLGQQPFYPSPIYPQPIASPGYMPSPVSYGSEFVPAYPWDASPVLGDGAVGNPTVPISKPNFSSHAPTFAPSKPTAAPKSSNPLETKGSQSVLDAPPSSAVQNQSLKPANKASQHGSGFQGATVLPKGYFPVAKFPILPNQGKGGLLYSNASVNIKANGRNWVGEKLKIRGKANETSDFDLLNEQNRGPRTNNAKNNSTSVDEAVASLGAQGSVNSNVSSTVRRDQFNLPDFPTKYDQAMFYVIKSYSEDDIHKSIKYNVWASTPNGNKRLDSAYQDAQERVVDKGSKCPVFLFFSVNASGQFCGVAEMVGRVDFNKNMDFWQQDKWNGFFPVKWHIIKDVPNPQFRHIILENNDNKPVTNSRDTQEVKFPQGIEMLSIFKNYSSKTSILDDFGFYESRQKAMQDKRTRPFTPHLDHLQPKLIQPEQVLKKIGPESAVSCNHSVATKKNKEENDVVVKAKE